MVHAFCCDQGYLFFDDVGSDIIMFMGIEREKMMWLLEYVAVPGKSPNVDKEREGPVKHLYGWYFME